MKKQGLYDPANEHDACGIGAVVHIKGKKSHSIVKDALEVLSRLDHRGACGHEINTGDGAGILFQIPDRFFRKVLKGVTLPEAGRYGVGMVYLPRDAKLRDEAVKRFNGIVKTEGQEVLAWRDVPTDNSTLGDGAKSTEPFVRQVFIKLNSGTGPDALKYERKLYVIRKLAEHSIRMLNSEGSNQFYIPSLSTSTIVYKGQLLSHQMEPYYPDLVDADLDSAIALVHSRFSTNTFPNWNRAHPYRYVIHNGEINTLRGNINWMHAREKLCASPLFGKDLKRLLPIVDTDGSDSAMFDNVLEFLYLGGRSLPHAMMMMIPEPWENHATMSDDKKAFYEFHNCLMEPWDGPAAMAFTDGTVFGATLDRNGLRPSRFYVTKDDRLILASEAGVLDIAPEDVVQKGRLQPGKMLLVDTQQGRIITDEEAKAKIISEHPYRDWLDADRVPLEEIADVPEMHPETDHDVITQYQQAFGYTYEDLRVLMEPMAKNGVEAIGSMGTDTPIAVLSNKAHPLFNYFKQLFAQVTNPPIDAIREEIVTSGETTLGSEGNLLLPTPESCRMIELHSPIITNEELEKLRRMKKKGFKAVTLPIFFDVKKGGKGLEKALKDLFAAADKAIKSGANIVILSDKNPSAQKAPIPSLLASAGLHHHLIRKGTRTQVGLVLESGEPREVHHFACLIGYGVAAVNPWLAFETLDDMIADGMIPGVAYKDAVKKYCKAAYKGVIKAISKMGLSTIQAYRGAQIFEAVGLSQEVVDKYFTWTATRIGGLKIDDIAEEVKRRHEHAYPDRPVNGHVLEVGGQYQWRKEGEHHLFNPETVHLLQNACRTGNYATFKKYAEQVNNQTKAWATLRGLLEFKTDRKAIPIDQVESVDDIVKRFKTGAMSYGSISKEAHEGLAIAMNRVGGKSNTGEGGEDPERYKLEANGDSKNSAIKQVASGRFGVTSYYLVNAQEIQIKMAQGAKPGEGGQLPGTKVYPWVAKTRHTTAGVGLISPPPHHDIYSIEDLAELIHDLKNANDKARISVKLVSEVGVGTVAAGVAKAHADVVLISGYDGGTGASPQTSIKHAGLPWELGLAETHQTLVLNNLRSRIAVETDGQLKTGRDVVIAALLGAEEFGFATAPLVVLGCIMMRVCHLNTCPVGVATQDPKLRAKFTGDPAHVVHFMRFIAQEARELMAQLGFRTILEMVGHTEALEAKKAVDHWKAKGLDLSPILYQPKVGPEVGRTCTMAQDHGLEKGLDRQKMLEICEPAIQRGEKVKATLPVKNFHRVVGTMTGSEITRKHGPEGLPEDTVDLTLQGSAGQSFGAFIPKGMTLKLEGDANDYFGKGLSGGKLVVVPSQKSTFKPEENVIIGNVAFYGATNGESYIRGLAGERFAVRNSGVKTVVEGIGDHGCEYMTGGRVVVLGPTGRNFGAGMSGGVAYIWDKKKDFASLLNREMVDLEPLAPEDLDELLGMIQKHAQLTGSTVAQKVLADWKTVQSQFVKVMPRDYKRMLACIKKAHDDGHTGDEAILEAFEANAKDLARVGGN